MPFEVVAPRRHPGGVSRQRALHDIHADFCPTTHGRDDEGETMLVEERCYTLLPGRANDYFALYAERGLEPQSRYLDYMLGYYFSELGDLNEVVHLWGHASLDAREANRARMRADPDFQAYWHEVRGLIIKQRTRILRPAPFFTRTLDAIADAARAQRRHDTV